MKTFFVFLVLLMAANPSICFAKLKCQDGIVKKKGKILTTKQIQNTKARIEGKLATITANKSKVVSTEQAAKQSQKQTKLSGKLELLNNCGK